MASPNCMAPLCHFHVASTKLLKKYVLKFTDLSKYRRDDQLTVAEY